MPIIRSVATALPPHEIAQSAARELVRAHFAAHIPAIDRYMPVFQHAQIDTRFMAVPLQWFREPHSFKECNDLFIEVATTLGELAARRCLALAGLTPRAVDHIIWVSTTGLAAPSPDALLINRMGMGRHTRRTPIWGLGCAGGVAGLARADEYARAFPEQRVLLLSVELCSVTFQRADVSPRNLVAAALFGDGAAAVLVEGDAVAPTTDDQSPISNLQSPISNLQSPISNYQLPTTNYQLGALEVLGTQSTLWPDTLGIMGWNIVDTGMEVVFATRIPAIVTHLMRDNVSVFLAQHGLTLDDIDHWILHPGGTKVIAAYERALGVDPERLHHTRAVLRTRGNMSSATVFFVLEEFMQAGTPAPGEYGLLAVLGPGFSCELALVRGSQAPHF